VRDVKDHSLMIGQRIRELRKRREMTQEALSEQCGVNASYIGQIERGEKQPSVRVLVSISNALGLELNDLLSVGAGPRDEAVRRLLDILSDCPAEMIDVVSLHAEVVRETFTRLARTTPGPGNHRDPA
jgi:transcriptional regulator with XRE-family HTH domain